MPLMHDAPVHRFLEQYAKQYHAGAFATPTRKELEARPELIAEDTRYGEERAVVIARRLSRDSERTDFTGARFGLPKGAYLATHIGRTPNLTPSTGSYDYVMAYAEDRDLSLQLAAEDRRIKASRVTAAAEVINVWGPPGRIQPIYWLWDRATVIGFGRNPLSHSWIQDEVLAEVAKVRGWDDDFPYYSDGSWSAVCLKGFWPDEPGRGVKPAEMPKTWKAQHPEALQRKCQWTVLAEDLPRLSDWVQSLPWQTERVRLLKMNAGGKLGRHTDITDRDGGTRDGQIMRFHVPLITDPSIKLITWDLDGSRTETHLKPFEMYYLDARKPHAVTNPSSVNRVHLVIDAVADAALRHLVGATYLAQQR